jgi:hypothetical protein
MMPGLRPCMLLGLTAVLVGCENGPATTPSMGTLERDRIELAADSNEPIVELLVDEGDRSWNAPGPNFARRPPAWMKPMPVRAQKPSTRLGPVCRRLAAASAPRNWNSTAVGSC